MKVISSKDIVIIIFNKINWVNRY